MKIDFDNNPKILNEFIYYLQGILNYSEKTIEGYNFDLLQFFNFIKKYYNLSITVKEFNMFTVLKIKESDVIAFLVYLNFNRNNNPYTRQRKLCSIRRFYKWLFRFNHNITQQNPTLAIGNIQKIERLPKYLNLEDAKKIQTVFTIQNTRNPHRNNAIISLFLNTGLRIGELININIQDVNFQNNSIDIIGKGNKERQVYFSSTCKELLINYLKIRNKNSKIINKNEPLFISCRNKRLGIDGVSDICQKAYKLIGLENKRYTSHTLRHTAATLMYIYNSQDLLLVKKFLGHSQISTTQIYTHICNDKLKKAVESNPLNELFSKNFT